MINMKNPLLFLLVVILVLPACAADNPAAGKKLSVQELIGLSQTHNSGLRAAIEASFDAKDLKNGTAWAGQGPAFFFAVEAVAAPMLIIDANVGLGDAAGSGGRSCAGSGTLVR